MNIRTRVVLAFNRWLASEHGFLQAVLLTLVWTVLACLGLDPHGFWFLFTVSAFSFLALFCVARFAALGADGATESAARAAAADAQFQAMLDRLDEADRNALMLLEGLQIALGNQEELLETVAAAGEQLLALVKAGEADEPGPSR